MNGKSRKSRNKNGSLVMNEAQTGASSALFGSRSHISVSRGLDEFHGRRPVLFTATGEAVLALPVEGLDRQRLFEFMARCAPVMPQLIVTERRALALGLDASMPMALTLSAGDNANTILALVTDATNHRLPAVLAADVVARAVTRRERQCDRC